MDRLNTKFKQEEKDYLCLLLCLPIYAFRGFLQFGLFFLFAIDVISPSKAATIFIITLYIIYIIRALCCEHFRNLYSSLEYHKFLSKFKENSIEIKFKTKNYHIPVPDECGPEPDVITNYVISKLELNGFDVVDKTNANQNQCFSYSRVTPFITINFEDEYSRIKYLSLRQDIYNRTHKPDEYNEFEEVIYFPGLLKKKYVKSDRSRLVKIYLFFTFFPLIEIVKFFMYPREPVNIEFTKVLKFNQMGETNLKSLQSENNVQTEQIQLIMEK